MNEQDFRDSRSSCYSLAHTIAISGMMQERLVNELKDCEVNETGYTSIIKAMLEILLSNLT
jgi:hypothetical protein